MGKAGAPLYNEDLANSIEAAKKLIAKIETNKYDKYDLIELAHLNAEIISYAIKNENED